MVASVLAWSATARVPHVSKTAIVWPVALAGLAAAGGPLTFALHSGAVPSDLGEPLVISILAAWISASYVLCGLLAWSRRPASRFGPLMIVAGFVSFAATLSWTTNEVTFTFGQALDLLPPVLFLHVFLAFPSGRLSGRFERSLVAAAYATAISLELVRMVFGGFGPNNLLEVSPNPAVADQVLRIQLVLVSAYCLAGVGVLVLRRLRAGRPRRRSLALLIDAFALALVMIAFLFLSAALDGPAVAQIRWATFAALGLAPLAFLIGLLHSRLARSAAGELLVELREDPEPADLRDALARALQDPSLALAYWLPEFERWADLDGHEVRLPAKDSARATTRIDREGASVAVLVHDPSLDDEPELLAAVSAGAAIALEHGRLHAELRARLGELRGSRARVLEAGQNERQRLERNLHDGAQQRLIALSLDLGLLEERLRDDLDAAARLHEARHEIALSLGELRDVARGLHPAVVSGHGLAVALESLAAHAAVPVRLTVELEGRVREQLEVAAYYVVAESLTNIGKHARAKSATVDVARVDGQVVVEVVDDGVGGADTERGSGLRGLADRVESLGGRLRVWTPRGGGTRVRAELPCV
jgi:signal transduction histidine kinase